MNIPPQQQEPTINSQQTTVPMGQAEQVQTQISQKQDTQQKQNSDRNMYQLVESQKPELDLCKYIEDPKSRQDSCNAFSKLNLDGDMCTLEEFIPRLMKRESTSILRGTQQSVQYNEIKETRAFIVYKIYDPECKQFVIEMISILQANNCQVFVEESVFEEFHSLNNQVLKFTAQFESIMSVLLTIGGDGTILYALKYFQEHSPPPILAFEKGTLGFMCNFKLKNMVEVLHSYVGKLQHGAPFIIETKMRLQGKLQDEDNVLLMEYHSLNEFVISRGANPSCLYMEVYIQDTFLTVASGDGMIVCTPTGSTAYFLSAGGPIVQNEVGSICIAPICPLSLSFRPIVLNKQLQVKIKLSPQSRQSGFICADGQHTVEFQKGMTFVISDSINDVKVIQQKSDNDYSLWAANLRKKLSWNKGFTDTKEKKSKL